MENSLVKKIDLSIYKSIYKIIYCVGEDNIVKELKIPLYYNKDSATLFCKKCLEDMSDEEEEQHTESDLSDQDEEEPVDG